MFNKKNILSIGIVCLVSIVIYGYNIYLGNVDKLKEIIIPSIEGASVSATHLKLNSEDSAILKLNLNPGSVYEGQIALKNHYNPDEIIENIFSSFYLYDIDSDSYINEDDAYVMFNHSNIETIVQAKDYVVLDYIITIPQNIDNGYYRGSIQSMIVSDNNIQQSGLVIKVAHRILIDINVSDDVIENNLIEVMSDYKEFALKQTLLDMRGAVSVLFGFISLSVLFYSFIIHNKK